MHDPGQPPVQQSPIAKIYGEIVYWCTIVASILVIISTMCAFLGMHVLVDPAYLFSSIWTGKEAAEIWLNSTGQLPDAHWYLHQLWNADSLAMLGIILGIFSVVPASFAASAIFFRQGQTYFGVMGLLTGLLILLPCLGLI